MEVTPSQSRPSLHERHRALEAKREAAGKRIKQLVAAGEYAKARIVLQDYRAAEASLWDSLKVAH
ncbi:MAG TPA: hypothetical protein VD948_08845 [Rhodothermales bacterium]|nr:hypothetical protein [Rhodothermales bacterium]